ncbi:MAG: lipopolysaccharide heptosyltransferase II [Candidatus Zixiibacteriota bacterium]
MKLIVRAPNWVGDAVMALPAIDNLKKLTAASHIAVMARKATAPLFINHPDIDLVVEIDDKSNKILGPKRAADAIKGDHFDIGILFPPSFSSALIFKLAGVTGRVGFDSDNRKIILTRAVKSPAEPMHRMQSYLYLLEKVTGKKPKAHNPQVSLSHEDIQGGEEALGEVGLSYDDAYVAVAPRAIGESRRWGSEKYGNLARRIVSELDKKIVLVGTADDSDAAEEIKAFGSDKIFNLCGKTSLRSVAAVLSFAKLFIGNDSGLAHLAGAVNCPLVVLSGPDDPAETSPVCDAKTVIIKDDLDCISCVKNKCLLKGDAFMRCMRLITVDEVFDAVTGRMR